ncbi:ATP-dependent helicase HrpB [Paenibacillus radicis (ex Xue et al. 2023)]|uniref:ATP-dependent helicase HrpB n=1 Tax=Paenibacillus radicis (ex Xue et al. 2023) TaxID=2972489 RepID=A0ABT1YT10_9BACL|nr:ATP-dependent helicase HrpB [Paenibacillus radicis (ex Xue et al. 2023)]MCR8635115.1 ATP-dependent helicase HrpB [Paenibacillus radicis (ex Xue et al. 2023)]
MIRLPIEPVLPEIIEALGSSSNAVLVAPPGAGKTTRVPLALLESPRFAGQRILMLEPRRLAARSAARFMASALGEQVGQTVGYRVRLDSKVGPDTRIEVITEGVLTRLLQSDPSLEGVGIVIFDEYHERSLHADLGLALCLQAQAVLRDDLRILVMSATLDAEPVAALLNNAPVIRSEGRMFPVETVYLERQLEGRIEAATVRCIVSALEAQSGDLLVFLPGAGEIRRTEAQLRSLQLGPHVRIAPLHSSLPQEAQDLAIAPSPHGTRKVVLATTIAESSLTVEGVRIVIDSGLMRVPRFSPRTGMTRLETVTVSRASADQRRGRAGRLESGVCYRLWTEQDDRRLAARSTPEMLEADLAPLALELAAWGAAPDELLWLDPPPAAAYAQARELLSRLGALAADGTLSAQGRQMADLGIHPRLAHMILQAVPLGLGGLACELAALLNERDILRGDTAFDCDLRLRLEALKSTQAAAGESSSKGGSYLGYSVDTAACKRIRAEAQQWKRALGISSNQTYDVNMCGLLLAFAYPDRIAQRRTTGRFLLSNGRGAVFTQQQPLSNAPYLVAAELDDLGPESRIYSAAPIDLDELELHFKDQIEVEALIVWDRSAQAVRGRSRSRLGCLILKEAPLSAPHAEDTLAALLSGIAEEGLELLPWSKASRQYRERLSFMHLHDSSWPDVSDHALLSSLKDWLGPHAYGLKSRGELQRLNIIEILESMLTWDQRRELDSNAPTHITVPSGSRIPVDYSDPASPSLNVRLQEMFGLQETPRIAGRNVPLTLHLLSPAQRPVQVTQDLASFWRNAYFEIKKDLKGRYPKHYWPDDPLIAMPTSRVRPRS